MGWLLDPRHRGLVLPLSGLALLLLVAYAAPLIAPYDPVEMQIAERLQAPSLAHPLGQDEFGRDIWSRLIHGARVSLSVAIIAALISAVIGVTIGLIGGYFRGWVELVTLRVVDVVLSFPPILLALLVVTLFGPGTVTLTAVLSVLFAPGFARVTYGEVLSAREMQYVEAVQALGATAPRIILGTVLPNIIGPIIVQFSLTIASAILIESGLSFLGLGVVPPDPSWGLMIRGARSYMAYSPMGLIWPCLALVLTVLLFNGLCDALRDVFDPKTRGRKSLLAQTMLGRGLAPDRVDERPSVGTEPASAAPEVGSELAPEPTHGSVPELAEDQLLAVHGLTTRILTPDGIVHAVEDVSFVLRRGETLAVVGESGSGKSMTGLSILRLLPEPGGRIVAGTVHVRVKDGRVLELTSLAEKPLEAVRGEEIAMIFQEPMTSLNPVYTIGDQVAEALRPHRALGRAEAMAAARGLLARVGIPDPAALARSYPHELSGGQRQRAMIAMALACAPRVLIADEPTTALDVTIQAQILDLLRTLKRDTEASFGLIFITHNLGLVVEMADRVLVMYAGEVVEEGPVDALFARPRHPYTEGLLASVPSPGGGGGRLTTIPGNVPSALDRPDGCAFAPRCRLAIEACRTGRPALVEVAPGHRTRCLRFEEL